MISLQNIQKIMPYIFEDMAYLPLSTPNSSKLLEVANISSLNNSSAVSRGIESRSNGHRATRTIEHESLVQSQVQSQLPGVPGMEINSEDDPSDVHGIESQRFVELKTIESLSGSESDGTVVLDELNNR